MLVFYFRVCFLALIALFFAFQSAAAGLVTADRQLRDDLMWLADRHLIAVSLSTWPLSLAEIQRALATLPDTQDSLSRQVVNRVQRRIAQLKAPAQLTGYAATDRNTLPQGMGNGQSAGQNLRAAMNSNGDFWDLTLQGNLEGTQWIPDSSHLNPNGSYAAFLIANQWLSFGEIPQWWGPGHDASLIRSDAARPVLGFLLQRDEQRVPESRGLAWLGRWHYQLFAGQLRQYSRPEEPKLVGGRLTVAPGQRFELGLSRVMMWGGKGRPQNFAAFRDAFVSHDNTGNQKNDPGDQLAGIDFRFSLASAWGIPVSLYGQVIGDDQAGILPSHNTWLGGVEWHNAWGNRQLNGYFEAADTRSQMKTSGIIYYHYCYHGGFYQQGWPLADAMGGDGSQYSARMEVVLENDQRISLRGVLARVNRTSQSFNQAYPRSDTLQGVDVLWTYPLSENMTLSPGGWLNRSDRAGQDLGMSIQFSLYGSP